VGIEPIDDVLDEAVGRRHRPDPVLGRTAGPAGNAQLTAWTGLLLLALTVVELVTLIDVHGLLSWHVVVGVLLAAVATLKIASTGWRFLRYYAGHRPYQQAGPPERGGGGVPGPARLVEHVVDRLDAHRSQLPPGIVADLPVTSL